MVLLIHIKGMYIMKYKYKDAADMFFVSNMKL